MIQEIESKKALTFHQNSFPTNWDLNPYRGCTIGCKYCFAQYSHKYLGLKDFFKDIIVKTNIAKSLENEIKKSNWKKEQIKIGGTTDLYQHIEQKYELLPQIFQIIKRYKNPIFIQTKSTLLLRDFEIIKELSHITEVDIAISIITLDEGIRKILEPGASAGIERIKMVSKFNHYSRSTILSIMPIIPFITDSIENLEAIFKAAKENNIKTIVTSFLFLKGETKDKFFEIVKLNFPEIYPDFVKLYSSAYVPREYADKINELLLFLSLKYQINDKFEKVTIIDSQLSLF